MLLCSQEEKKEKEGKEESPVPFCSSTTWSKG
jgi:hypothetical protein